MCSRTGSSGSDSKVFEEALHSSFDANGKSFFSEERAGDQESAQNDPVMTLEDPIVEEDSAFNVDDEPLFGKFDAGSQLEKPLGQTSTFRKLLLSQPYKEREIYGRQRKYDGPKKRDFQKTLESLESRSKTLKRQVLCVAQVQ